jgi:hypothetical protein
MIRVPRCRQPTWAIDLMHAPSARLLLHALTLWILVQPAGYAAGTGVSGGEGVAANDIARRGQLTPVAGGPRRSAVRRDDPGQELASRRSEASTHRSGSAPAAQRGLNAVARTGAAVWKPTMVAAPAHSIRRQPDYGRSAPAPVATSAPLSAGRPHSIVLPGASRPPTMLRAVAGNGVIGGAHAAAAGWVGGPANTRTVNKGGIDGSALRRRS